MIKKVLATAAAATSLAGFTTAAAAAPPGTAHGYDKGPASITGNETIQSYGNSATYGNMSPQFALIQGSFNKPCIALPEKLNINSLIALIPISVQDINLFSSKQHQTCVENSTMSKGNDAVTHFVEDIPLLSENGVNNG
ncbi:rodlin [Streptomyces sp. MST-110588]|uniref:rodlin n=1 Tax=Streptomyces sp. MST-110588 TaxID=2833628 RepID=UPI001F5D9905|nr:rodlin [Streptomyces sp. MST-110588]UNO41631.1 RdlA protein [Streptomyces sp. MST-110588]